MCRKIVKKHRDLILAKNTWTEIEGKLLATLIKELNPKSEDDFRLMKINIEDIEELWGKKQVNITRIRKTCSDLKSKTYEIPILKENGQIKAYHYRSLFSKINYELENKYITFKFDDDMKPFILDFTRKFVAYNIENILQFKSKYSISFYERFKYDEQFKRETFKTEVLEISYIQEWLKLPKSYEVYGNLKKKILDKVVEDLKKYSDININFEPIKTKRKTTHIKFTFTKNVDKTARQECFFSEEELKTEYDNYIGVKYKDQNGDIKEIKQIKEVLADSEYIKLIVYSEFLRANEEIKMDKRALTKLKK